jgi:4-alpha-glucanotransferase
MQTWQIDPLVRLARLSGIQPTYFSTTGETRRATPEEMLGACRALGYGLAGPEDAPEALRQARLAQWQRGTAPVVVAWQGEPVRLLLKIPASLMGERLNYELKTEDGQHSRAGFFTAEQIHVLRRKQVEETEYLVVRLQLAGDLPWGYHRLSLELPAWKKDVLVISAPVQAWEPAEGIPTHAWGAFMPLYALRTPSDWGCGDFTDLAAFQSWLHSLGASVMATLPLLASFLRPEDGQFEPSPYAPASRLFWNELFIDPSRVPELENSAEARALLASDELRRELEELRDKPLVDYARSMAAKRRVLEVLASGFFATPGARWAEFEAFVKRNPAVEDYARFRAAFEKQGQAWVLWPEPAQSGTLQPGDYDPAVAQYHMYVQWVAQAQVDQLCLAARAGGLGLYLDMPLGVHPDSYDVWRGRGLFAREASAGAPPDSFFAAGQDWGFPPLHPERDREQGYRYFISYVQQLMSMAGILRIDHVAGLHRLYWIPRGLSAKEGVYVHYHGDELYAILCLESHRTQTIVVGEDLGTIPNYVRHAMDRHQVRRMFVQMFAMHDDPEMPLGPVDAGTVASLNTHDLPLFAGLWYGVDIDTMQQLGFLSEAAAAREWVGRNKQKAAMRKHFGLELADEGTACWQIMQRVTQHLVEGDASVALISMEDLWLEREPQNVPGTWRERPNWRRKAALSFADFTRHGEVLGILNDVNQRRRGR